MDVSEQAPRGGHAGPPHAVGARRHRPARRGLHFRQRRLIRVFKASSLGPRYWWLWGATSISSVGDGLAFVGFPLLATTYTRDGLALSGLLAAQRLPWLVCSLPLGALADRTDRRRMAMVIELARMTVLVAFAAGLSAGHGGLGLLYATAFVLGALEAGFFAAMSATVPSVVGADQLTTANGHLYAARTAGEEFIGPAVGGAIFAAAAALPFLLDGVSFAASAGLLLLVFPRRRRAPGRAVSQRPSLWEDVVEGLRYLARHRLLRLLGAVVAGLAFCQAMAMGVLVLYGVHNLHLSRAGYGLFLGVGALGSVSGGALAGRATARVGTARLLIASGAAAALAYLLLGARASLPLAAVALLVESLAVAWGNVSSLSLRQTIVPPEFLGRTGNAFRMVVWGVIPIGALLGGLIAHLASLPAAFIGAGVLQLLLVVVSAGPLAELIDRTIIDLRDSTAVITIRDSEGANLDVGSRS